MFGYLTLVAIVCITLGIVTFIRVKNPGKRLLAVVAIPFLVSLAYYSYAAIVSSATDEFITWSGLFIGIGTLLGIIPTALGLLIGKLYEIL